VLHCRVILLPKLSFYIAVCTSDSDVRLLQICSLKTAAIIRAKYEVVVLQFLLLSYTWSPFAVIHTCHLYCILRLYLLLLF